MPRCVSELLAKKNTGRNPACITFPCIVNKAGITKSQFSRFMSSDGPKGLSRDSMLKICIVLGYNIDYIRTLLHRSGLPDLYPRDRRDYLIIKGIIAGEDLRDIDEKLESEGMETLWTDKKTAVETHSTAVFFASIFYYAVFSSAAFRSTVMTFFGHLAAQSPQPTHLS